MKFEIFIEYLFLFLSSFSKIRVEAYFPLFYMLEHTDKRKLRASFYFSGGDKVTSAAKLVLHAM